jgi:Holliday junction resolvase RusA-like endonuclease
MRKKDPEGRMLKVTRPDIDNVVKSILDGMREVWSDDSVVCDVRAEKYYAAKGEEPHALVTVEAMCEPS